MVIKTLLVFILGQTALAAVVELSPTQVAEQILKNSDSTQEINLKTEQTRLALAQVLSAYDLSLFAETGYEVSKLQALSASASQRDQTNKTSITLKKPFAITGTLLGFEYNRTSVESEYPLGYTLPSTGLAPQNSQALDIFGITLEQPLWKNFFGQADRAKTRAAKMTYQAGLSSRADQLQQLVLSGLRLYWATYVAQQTFQEALNSRDRYQKLADAVRKKSSLSYSGPGELSQAQAELEGRYQKVKTESINYLSTSHELIRLLKIPAETEIKFAFAESLAPPKVLPSVKIEELRRIQALRMSLAAAEDTLISAESSFAPELSLVGKYYQSGLASNSSAAYEDLNSGSHPKYYIGIKVSYNFGADLPSEDKLNKKVSRELANIVLSKSLLETIDVLDESQRKVQANYAILESTKQQKIFREKAAQELNRAYTQGRTDITLLITAINNFYDTQIQYAKAVGDYQVALNELAALRDELIPDVKRP